MRSSSQFRYRHRIVGLLILRSANLRRKNLVSSGCQFDGSRISRQQVERRHTKRQPFAGIMIQINQVSF
jgi:hypothetical protein